MVAQPCKIVFQFSDVLCAKVGLWIGTTHAQRTVGISTAIEMMLGLNGTLDDPKNIGKSFSHPMFVVFFWMIPSGYLTLCHGKSLINGG